METLLQKCNEEYYNLILERCCDKLMELVKDKYGCYIVRFFIKKQVNIDKLFELIKEKVLDISQKQFGFLVISAIIESENENQISKSNRR